MWTKREWDRFGENLGNLLATIGLTTLWLVVVVFLIGAVIGVGLIGWRALVG